MEDKEQPQTLSQMAEDAARSDRGGIVCPQCHGTLFRVYYTRPQPDKILRRKICMHCRHMITTVEKAS